MGGVKKDKKDKDRKLKDKNAKPGKLQLKGRIFMTNVSDVISLVKPGSYTVQIWWKGDPGVENFIIRFTNEETMKKWSTMVSKQRKECNERAAESGSATDTEPANFAWMKDQAKVENPYQEEDEDEDHDSETVIYQGNGAYGKTLPRNASNNSLRSRSTTGESHQSLASVARQPPPRFPMGFQQPPLSLQTHGIPAQAPSPGPRGGDSYFSPVAESPASSRTSQNSQVYPFPRQATPQGGWEEHNRYTAPAMARVPSRDSSQPPSSNYPPPGRNPQRPSLPAMASNSAQNAANAQQRSRSYSTPDVNGPNGTSRRLPNGQLSTSGGGSVPAVPGIPAHLAYDAGIPRSNSNSPINSIPIRSSTQSPGAQRDRLAVQQSGFAARPGYGHSNTTQIPTMATMDSRTMSPPLQSTPSNLSDTQMPTQLKVKVNCDGNYVTLVVAFNISYQTLIDRIDAKLSRFSNNAIARGTMRLRYRDEDGDFLTMDSDEDIQIAFTEWREEQAVLGQGGLGGLGEIELFCQSVDP